MAIPFQLPALRDTAEDYQSLDKLLSDLFEVLARILAQRGEPVSALSTGSATIRRPTYQLRLQALQAQGRTEEDELELDVSAEEFSSDGDSEAGSAPASPTSTSAPVSLPDLLSGLPDLAGDLAGALAEVPVETPRAPPARSRSRKPGSRKGRSGNRKRASNNAANVGVTASPAKDITRTPASTRAQKTSVC